jgi:hypothetical protein
VITGTNEGPVTVYSELLSNAPETLQQDWDVIAERDIVAGPQGLDITDLYQYRPRRHLQVPPGRYRVRIHVRDRALAAQHNQLDAPLETHLIQIWPSSSPFDPAVRTGPDEVARHYLSQ